MSRPLTIAVLAGLALLLGAGPATAHPTLISTDPPTGATLSTAPQRVSLRFNEPVVDGMSTISVVGPGGTQWVTGGVTADGTAISTAVKPLGPAGLYTVGYRVISQEGHPVTGTVQFRFTGSGTGTGTSASASTATAPAASSTPPSWLWLVIVLPVLAAAALLILRTARHRRPPRDARR